MDPLFFAIVLSSFNLHINITSQSSLQLCIFYYLWFCIINFFVDRPWSCRVIYYFDTHTLGKRHQSFNRVNKSHHSLCLLLGYIALGNQSNLFLANFFEFIKFVTNYPFGSNNGMTFGIKD